MAFGVRENRWATGSNAWEGPFNRVECGESRSSCRPRTIEKSAGALTLTLVRIRRSQEEGEPRVTLVSDVGDTSHLTAQTA